MPKVFRLALREYVAAVRTKAFLLGLVLGPVFMCGSFFAMVLTKDQVDTTDKRVAVVDRSGALAQSLLDAAQARNEKEVADKTTGKKLKPAYLLEVVPPNAADPQGQRLALSDRVRRKELHAFLEIGAEVLQPRKDSPRQRVEYYAKSPALDDVRRWIEGPLNDQLRQRRLREAGIDPAAVGHLLERVSVDGLGLIAQDAKTGEISKARRGNAAEALGPAIVLQLLLFILFMIGAAPLLQSVMEEKTQRIAELLLGSVTPFELMLGKLLGGVAVSLTGAAVYLLAPVLVLTSLALAKFIPYHILPWFLAYMLTAMFMYGAIFAALGSACVEPKDAQALQFPAMLPMMIPMFLLGPVLKEPNSAMAIWLSLFPPFTPMLMLLRQSLPEGVPAWQPWVGLAGVLVCTVLSVWASGRIFRVGILMQGKVPRLTELGRWAIRG
ncbi:MAG: ABC transporter permease [Verrucomicrobia bacterium]|nr:ABC transporter permease [Verrucomicrobiota bacterium]